MKGFASVTSLDLGWLALVSCCAGCGNGSKSLDKELPTPCLKRFATISSQDLGWLAWISYCACCGNGGESFHKRSPDPV